MSGSAQAVSLLPGSEKDVSHDSADRNMLLPRIKHQAQLFVAERLQELQNNADDTLFELAGKTQDEELHYLYLDTISRLRNQRLILKDTFVSRFNALYNEVLEHQKPDAICFVADNAAIDKLLLNGDDDLECAVAIKNLATRFAEQQSLQLQSITHLYAELNGSPHNPLHPIVLCIAWKNAVDRTTLSPKARFVAYKLFAKFMLSELPNFYKTTLAQAAHMGIVVSPRRDNVSQALTPAVASDLTPGKTKTVKVFDVDQISRDLILKRVVEILRGSAAADATQEKRAAGIIDALAILQEYQMTVPAEHKMATDPASYLTGMFARLLHTARAERPNQNEQDVVDLVNVLVDGIAGDARLDERTRALVGTLRFPLLKLTYLDATFLTDATHCGRRLLQGLLDAALAATPADSAELERVYAMSKQVVERVLLEFRRDVATVERIIEGTPLFSRARDAGLLTKAADAHSATYDLIESRFARKIPKRAISSATREFLATTWTSVMQKIRDTKGTDDSAWHSALQCIDDLAVLELAQQAPPSQLQLQTQLLETIPRLLCGLQSGLALVAFDRSKKEKLFNQILSVHAHAIQNAKTRAMTQKKAQLSRTALA